MSEDYFQTDFFGQQTDWSLPGILDAPDFSRISYGDFTPYQGTMEMKQGMNTFTCQTSSQGMTSPSVSAGSSGMMSARKRKCPSVDLSTEGNDDDDDGTDDADMKKFARQNHSEIEKRRRDKMNTYIMQLSTMLPMCNAMNRKCDKLTVLRMAVQHMKSLRGSSTSYTEALHKPSFLSEDELKHIILEAADGFLFVVGCDRARILFVSESVGNILHYTRNELIGQSLFDYIHPRDISKVKEQFSSSDLAPRERLIDAKTLMPVKTELPQRPTHLCSGARRSFYCRMKYRSEHCDGTKGVKFEKEDMEYVHRKRKTDQKAYTVIHFTGYLKSWPTSKINISSEDDIDDSCNFLSCLVAVGQTRTSFNQNSAHHSMSLCAGTSSGNINNLSSCGAGFDLRPMEYMFRISLDGKLTFIDQATTVVLGYLPQELIGTSVYEYYHQDDLTRMAEIHRKVLNTKEKVQTGVYRFKAKNGSFLPVRSTSFSFRNPWTKDVEYIVSTNSVVPNDEVTSSGQGYESAGVLSLDTDCSTADCSTADELSASNSHHEKLMVPGLPGGTKAGAGRIGRQIADEVLENSRQSRSPQVVDSTNTEVYESQLSSKRIDTRPGNSTQSTSGQNANINISLPSTSLLSTKGPNGISVPSSSRDGHVHESTSLLDTVIEEQAMESLDNGPDNENGDEAAMSMIMSLLEADAGLGGPIDFNDLPWPL
ncbi:hypothetical protein ACF0H5_016269 [Mactra antiquata]